jgi:hypothetical protein
VHPYTLQPIKTAKTREEKQNQNKYFFWYKPDVKNWIRTRLQKLDRMDLAERLLTSKRKDDFSTEKGSFKKKRVWKK